MANIDYEEQITQIEDEKQQKLTETEEMYGEMLEQTKQKYDDLAEASKGWVTEQSALQQQQTDYTIDQIEQQKEQTEKDYTKEQSGAYADWQKESNRYGAGAEELAAAGLSNSGYSESSQVQMYNTYQNRVATARASYDLAVMNYNNAIREAQLQNSSALAEIAYTGLQQQLELALQGLQYENQLLLDLEGQKAQIEDTYHNRYLDVLDQMNADRAFEESVRQYNQDYEEGVRRFNEEMARLKAQDEANEAIIEDTPEEETKASGYTGRFLTIPGMTAGNKEITDFIEKNLSAAGKKSSSATAAQNSISRTNTQKLSAQEKRIQAEQQKADIVYEVSTDYYRGAMNRDVETFGTFKNGYQPKGISGHGKLTKTGDEYEFDTTKQYGTKRGKTVTVRQNIWKAEDGTLWYWDGVDNEYKPMPEE